MNGCSDGFQKILDNLQTYMYIHLNEISNKYERMNMKNYFLFLILGFFICGISCEKNSLNPPFQVVRAAIEIPNYFFPGLENATTIDSANQPWFLEFQTPEGDTAHIVRFSHGWTFSSGEYLDIRLSVAESAKLAYEYLLDMRKNCSASMDVVAPEDHPYVVGDISFGKGMMFIRDNIVVVISTYDIFEDNITEIAKALDALILKSEVGGSARSMKPVIERFEITQNPVPFESETKLVIALRDPMKGKMYKHWRFSPSENYGGIVNRGIEYYYYARSSQPKIWLTLIVWNDSGFCSSSTIEIMIQG